MQPGGKKNFSAMEPFLDENIVMKGPGLKEYAKGRLAFIESYAQFMANSHVTEYEESGNAVDIRATLRPHPMTGR